MGNNRLNQHPTISFPENRPRRNDREWGRMDPILDKWGPAYLQCIKFFQPSYQLCLPLVNGDDLAGASR